SADRTIKLWNLTTGKPALTLAGSEGGVGGLTWSPDGRQLASSGGVKPRVWEAATGKEVRTLVGTRVRGRIANGVVTVSWSPGGQWLVSENPDGTLKVWAAATGQEVQTLDMPGRKLWKPTWSPDGRWL